MARIKKVFTFALAFQKRSIQTEEKHSGCSAVRLAHLLWEQGVVGSNPATPTKGLISLKIRPFSLKKNTFSVCNRLFMSVVNKSSILTRKAEFMGRKRTVISLPHLVDAGGDLCKDWFVEYSCRDPRTNNLKRFREYAGFKKLKTAKERCLLADKVIQEIKDKFETGWTPFEERKLTYQDELITQVFADRWGRERESLPTIRTYLSEFLESKKTTIIQHSYQTYQSKLRIFAEWAEHQELDKIHISCITRENIYAFMSYIVEENQVSKRTIKKYKQILHGFFDYMMKERSILTSNPVHDIPDIGRVTDEAPRPIPDKIRDILITYMKKNDPQLWLFCQMEYYCAIRPNELRQLRIGDMDFESRIIRVPCTISKNRLTEFVNMPQQLYNGLIKAGIEKINGEWYLFSANGQPGEKMLGKNNFRFRFDRIRNRLGLSPEYKLYSFKHTGGVELVNAGVDTWELQRHFRHKSIDTTERYIRKNFAVNSDKIKNHFPDM